MKSKEALEILEIKLNKGKILELKYLKKQYHKMALLYHPDKNGNTLESNEKFKQINEAFNCLKREISISNIHININEELNSNNEFDFDFDFSNEENTYTGFLKMFVNNIIQETFKFASNNSNISTSEYKEIIQKLISDIVGGCKKVSLKLFEHIDKETALNIYDFLSKYKSILHLNQDLIDEIKEIIMEKYKNDQIYILNPSIDDLLDNNLYKLEICGEKYFVPLWMDEVYFDKKDDNSEIIVKCIPQLPTNVEIDENNNIIMYVDISFTFSLLDKDRLIINLGKKELEIKINQLYIQRFQTYYFYNQGIAETNTQNLYSIEKKNNIICFITFVE